MVTEHNWITIINATNTEPHYILSDPLSSLFGRQVVISARLFVALDTGAAGECGVVGF